MYGQWVCTNQFVDTATQIGKQIVGGTIAWWIVGLLLAIISTAVTFIFISASL
jgi:hypothetical protein